MSSSSSPHRHSNHSRHPQPQPSAFPSHTDFPDLPPTLRLLCDIISSSPASLSPPSLLSRFDATHTRVTQADVEAVLKLSYAHPSNALLFFRWAGERCLRHLHSPYSWNLVVDMLGKGSHFDAMWDAVRSMRDLNILSLATFASIFASLASDDRAGEAFAAFRALPLYGVGRDTVALNSLLAAMSRAGMLEDGYAVLLEAAMAGARPDLDSFAVLLEGCENKRDVNCARKVFDEMIAVIGYHPGNTPAYDSFLVTLLKSSSSDHDHDDDGDDDDDGLVEAMRWLETLRRHGCSPGAKFFRAALRFCRDKRDGTHFAVTLWNGHIARGGACRPDTAMYNHLIAIHCQENQAEAAMRHLDQMVLHGAFPDLDTYNVLFQMLVRLKKVREAKGVLNEMLKNECLPTHTNCLLAFGTEDPDLCIEVWRCMLKHGIRPLEEAGNSLISLLNKCHMLPEACKYAEALIDNGVKLSSYNLSELKRGLKKVRKEYIHDRLLLKWKQTLKVGV